MSKRLLSIITLSSLTVVASSSAVTLPPPTLPAPVYVSVRPTPASRLVKVRVDLAGYNGSYTQASSSPYYGADIASGYEIFTTPEIPLSTMSYFYPSSGPYQVSPITTQTFHSKGMINAGGYHLLAIDSTGKYWGWGWQAFNRLSNGLTAGSANTPVQLYGGAHPDWEADTLNKNICVAAGLSHSLLIEGFKGGAAFGTGVDGELGNLDIKNEFAAIGSIFQFDGGAGIPLNDCVQATAGEHFSGFLVADHVSKLSQVFTCGVNNKGQLGRPTTTAQDRGLPNIVQTDEVLINGDGNSYHEELYTIEEIEFGDDFSLAREGIDYLDWRYAPGQVWVWGDNANGQLGIGNTTNQFYATRAKLNANTYLTDATSISGGDNHSAIVRWKDGDPSLQGSVWTMGSRANGRLGDGLTAGNALYPVQVIKADGTPLDHIIKVSAGSSHTLALDDQGHVWAWGYNGWGALGDNTATSRAVAAKVKNPDGTGDLSNISSISAGGNNLSNFSAAVGTDGTVYTWGINDYGQLGIGVTGGSRRLPQIVPNFSLGN